MVGRTITATMVAALTLLAASAAMPHEPPDEGCTAFSRDLAHEIKVMHGTAVPANAVSGESRSLPRLQLDTCYAVSLAPQERIRFAAKPSAVAPAKASK